MRIAVIIGVGVVLVAPCIAQQAAEQPADEQARAALSKTGFSLEVAGRWIGKSDLDASPGEVGVARVSTRLGVRHQLSDKVGLTFAAELEHSVYDFDNATGLIAGTSNPFDDATIATLSLGAQVRVSEQNAWFVTGFVRSAGESGADFNDTITGGGIVGFQRTFSKDLTLGIGVLASSELEGDVYIIPVPMVRWQIAERWSLATGQGADVRLAFAPSERWAFGLEAAWDRREFRLDDRGPLPSGVVDERHIPVGLFARFTPNANFSLDAHLGTQLGSEIEIENRNGNQVGQDDIDPALYAGLDLSIRF